MPRCYLLALCSGSSLDQQSNNVTLFNLVEQLNIPPGAPPPPGGLLPVEVHAYFALGPGEIGEPFEVRFAVVGENGLETYTDAFTHKSLTPRYRTRTLGIPVPPVLGMYEIRVDIRDAEGAFVRQPAAWPLVVVETTSAPRVTH